MDKVLRELRRLQIALSETSKTSRNSYEYSVVRPRLLKELKQTVEDARSVGVTESDIDDLVFELMVEIERRPIELENFWDPRRMSKNWRRT